MAEIKTIPVDLIDPNPYRNLDEYPWIEDKIETLQQSIDHVGFWEGVIARPHGKRYQLAFGHHRLEAARRNKLKEIPVIVRDLNDERMILFMGRENSEDYSSDFITMLNTWEGAVTYSKEKNLPTDLHSVAHLLGWVFKGGDGYDRISHTAYGCANAAELIDKGYIERSDVYGLSNRAVREIVKRASQRMREVDETARKRDYSEAEVKAMKECIGKATRRVLEKSRRGELTQTQAPAQVTIEIHRYAARAKNNKMPVFGSYGKGLITSLRRILSVDACSERLQEIDKVFDAMAFAPEDEKVIENIIFELGEIAKRANDWKTRLARRPTGITSQPVIAAIGERK